MSDEKRVVIDCRQSPQGDGCSLSVAGTEKEILEAIVPHAIARHGMSDTPETRTALKSLIKEDSQN